MSSILVRDLFTDYLTAQAPTEKQADITAGYAVLEDFLAEYSISMNDGWLGIQFSGSDEVPITVATVAGQGKFRETGLIFLHIVDVAKLGVNGSILARAEALRNIFRGKNIGGLRINSVTPPNFGLGATLEFESGFIAATVQLEYEYDLDI